VVSGKGRKKKGKTWIDGGEVAADLARPIHVRKKKGRGGKKKKDPPAASLKCSKALLASEGLLLNSY